jgi:5'-deoxynucleotidase YfbR-like HD superfamily hydrolase
MPKGPYIQTFTGREFYPFDVEPGMICIEDIAHALSMLCRYTGQCPRFYSVAEHSVHAADRAAALHTRHNYEKLGEVRHERDVVIRQALLHDASEAYLADLAQPIKHTELFQSYRFLEAEIQHEIYLRFELPSTHLSVVQEADRELLTAESCEFWGEKAKRWKTYQMQSYKMPIGYGMDPLSAEETFLSAWKYNGGKS